MDYINSLLFVNGYEMINKCYERAGEEKLWQMWLTLYPDMTKENYMTFADFKNEALNNAIKKEPQTDEQMFNIARLLNAAFGGEEVVS